MVGVFRQVYGLGFDLGGRTEGKFMDEEFGGGQGIERN